MLRVFHCEVFVSYIEELFVNIQKHLTRIKIGSKILNVLLIEHINLIDDLLIQEEKFVVSWLGLFNFDRRHHLKTRTFGGEWLKLHGFLFQLQLWVQGTYYASFKQVEFYEAYSALGFCVNWKHIVSGKFYAIVS